MKTARFKSEASMKYAATIHNWMTSEGDKFCTLIKPSADAAGRVTTLGRIISEDLVEARPLLSDKNDYRAAAPRTWKTRAGAERYVNNRNKTALFPLRVVELVTGDD